MTTGDYRRSQEQSGMVGDARAGWVMAGGRQGTVGGDGGRWRLQMATSNIKEI